MTPSSDFDTSKASKVIHLTPTKDPKIFTFHVLTMAAPGPVLQWLNELLHQEPFSFLFYGLYWCIILIILSPIMGILLMLQTVLKLARYLVGFDDVVPQQGMELGVIITGCDSGFGQQLAFALARDRFTVFAGCLRAEAMDQFKEDKRIIPLLMDVRKDDQVKAVASLVNKWISIGDSKTPRYLHGVVNNAGIGHGGLVDWVELEDFQQDMDGTVVRVWVSHVPLPSSFFLLIFCFVHQSTTLES